jgi:hypothetical protein
MADLLELIKAMDAKKDKMQALRIVLQCRIMLADNPAIIQDYSQQIETLKQEREAMVGESVRLFQTLPMPELLQAYSTDHEPRWNHLLLLGIREHRLQPISHATDPANYVDRAHVPHLQALRKDTSDWLAFADQGLRDLFPFMENALAVLPTS